MWFCGQQEIVIRQIGEVWNDTIGEKPSYGWKWRAGGQCAAASMRVNIHFSDADSGTAGIADEMSVQKAGRSDHRDHGEGSATDTAEPAGDTVPEGGLSNPNSIFPAVVAVPAEVVDRLDELLADTTDEPATDNIRFPRTRGLPPHKRRHTPNAGNARKDFTYAAQPCIII